MAEHLPLDERDENEEEYEAALDEAIGEALEGQPRAAEWRRMMNALVQRRAMLQDALDCAEDEDEKRKLQDDVAQLNEHIAALNEEAEITEFVEDTIRFSAEVRRLQSG